MTAIKQVGVTSPRHMANVAKYLSPDKEKALAMDGQNLVDVRNWAAEMDATREAYGHNSPSRAGAKVTYGYHQVIAFNPDEAFMQGGPVTVQFAMDFVSEWVRTRYPDYEAVWVAHVETCAADRTERIAVHVFVNRTNLATGLRLAEGRGEKAKRARAQAMREMDARHGLKQLQESMRNSRVHAMQPTRAEREMTARGKGTDKAYMRERIRARVFEIAREDCSQNRLRELARRLEKDGITMSVTRNGRGIAFQREGGRRVGGSRLGRGFSIAGIEKGLGMEIGNTRALQEQEGLER